MKLGSTLAFVLMILVAVAHALRLLFGITITAGDVTVPAWVSAVGIIVPLGIALLLWRERPEHDAG